MYEYKFVPLKEPRDFFGFVQASGDSIEETVRQHAAEGWRLVQIFGPVALPQHGLNAAFVIIFEKPK